MNVVEDKVTSDGIEVQRRSTLIDDDHLEISKNLTRQQLEELDQRLGAFVGGNDDREVWAIGPRAFGTGVLQDQLPEASVIKAFNTIFASNQANPSPEIDGYVAGDDDKAKQRVISLVESIGFAPVDVGPLSAARYLEGMAFINIGLNAANGWSWTSAWKLER